MDHQTAPKLPTRLKLYKYEVERIANRDGLSFWDTKYEMVSADEMSEVVARHGFPVMPAHWRTGMESIMNKKKFRYGMGRIFEIVIRVKPVIGFLMDSNHFYDNVAVMAHVCGHADMFLNNSFAQFADPNMDQVFASDATMIETFCRQYGEERVKTFFDRVLSIENLIDANSLYVRRPEQTLSPEEYETRRTKRRVEAEQIFPKDFPEYLESLPHNREFKKEEETRLADEEAKDREILSGLKIPAHPTKDVLQFLVDHSPLEPWQRSMIEMVRRSRYYFSQFRCKFLHEGWASLHEELIMREIRMDKDMTRWNATLASVQRKSGMNPYRLTYDLLLDVKHRWDTGRHGAIWEDCDRYEVKNNWDRFIVYHNLRVECAGDQTRFERRWMEFSQFLHELREGKLSYPKELFINDRFLGQYLLTHWAEYASAEAELKKYQAMLLAIEAKGLEEQVGIAVANLRAKKSNTGLSDKELAYKARRDVYDRAKEHALYLWTPDELKGKIKHFQTLVDFSDRYAKECLTVPAISIPNDWVDYSLRHKEGVVLGVGKKKWFEMRKTHDDFGVFDDFFTKEFCEREQYFLFKAKEKYNPETWELEKRYVMETRAFERIKRNLLFQFTDFHTPYIEVIDGNYKNNGELLLRHEHNGIDIDWWSKDGMFV
ncbi:MAG: SpoVR family protein, partial [Parcubacteria group bacterium]|nr:SpoVR family protein [Parcubacteria group bacterium]